MPPSLEELDLSGTYGTQNKFTGGFPSEWGSLTNLKKLSMVFCSLDSAARGARCTTARLTSLTIG